MKKGRPYTERELAIVLGNPPKTAQAKLRAIGSVRSRQSIAQTRFRVKRGDRGQRRPHTRFKPDEDKWLRKNFETATPQEITERFPHRGLEAVCAHARKILKLRKEKRLRARLPNVEYIDLAREIAQRARDDGISMAALDRETTRNSYWSKHWQRYPVQLDAVVKAVHFFGGRLIVGVDWQDK